MLPLAVPGLFSTDSVSGGPKSPVRFSGATIDSLSRMNWENLEYNSKFLKNSMSAPAAPKPSAPITHFRGILFPPAPIIFGVDDQKERENLIKPLIEASQKNQNTAVHLEALTNFNNNFTDKAIEGTPPRKKLVDDWIVGVQAALTALVQDANTLFLASIPEFGLNAYMLDGMRNFDARNVIPDTLETYIVNRLHHMLTTTFGAHRVLFMISCCTYGTTMRQDDPLGKRNTHRKLGGKSQITVISSSTAMPIRRIPKKIFGDRDGWASAERFTNIYDPAAEIRFDIDFPGVATPPAIGFTTCVDIEKEEHENVNLCMYFGAGFPLQNMKGTTHFFLLNDVKGWFPAGVPEMMYRTGYYRNDTPPTNASAIKLRKMIEDAYAGRPKPDVNAAWDKYWYDAGALEASQSFPPVECRATKPIPFPPPTSPSSSCTLS
ncbi:hypothetical protein K438DRAFT_1970777 [Mycena galopus ATCC 62051]|nr:hypothetical protein K438DRAFT_1970777 [Mycena galopus ATCC 62051]